MTDSKPVITIKKYANRRLYNTDTSSYITLADLSAMVRGGTEFVVYDARTGEDITRPVLTQIIVEEEGKSGQQNLLPVSFLRHLIGFYGDNMQWMVPKYLEQSMAMLAKNQEQLRGYMQSTFGSMFPFGSTLEEMGKQNLAMFEKAMRLFAPFGPPAGTGSAPTGMAPPSSYSPSSSSPAPASSSCAPASSPPSPVSPCASSSAPPSAGTSAGMASGSSARSSAEPMSSGSSSAPKIPPCSAVASNAAAVWSAPEPAFSIAADSCPTPTIAALLQSIGQGEDSAAESCASPSSSLSVCSSSSEATARILEPEPEPESAPSPVMAPVMPMTHVQSVAAAATPSADDMQQKIANLQRQLADLARGRG